jgi:hypothetical protein
VTQLLSAKTENRFFKKYKFKKFKIRNLQNTQPKTKHKMFTFTQEDFSKFKTRQHYLSAWTKNIQQEKDDIATNLANKIFKMLYDKIMSNLADPIHVMINESNPASVSCHIDIESLATQNVLDDCLDEFSVVRHWVARFEKREVSVVKPTKTLLKSSTSRSNDYNYDQINPRLNLIGELTKTKLVVMLDRMKEKYPFDYRLEKTGTFSTSNHPDTSIKVYAWLKLKDESFNTQENEVDSDTHSSGQNEKCLIQ